LDVTDGVDASGTKLQIYGCSTANKNQQWQLTGNDLGGLNIQWVNSTRCIDLTGGSQSAGAPLQIWTCQSTNNNQRWFNQYESSAPPANSPTIRLHSALQSAADRPLVVAAPSDQNNEPVGLIFEDEDNLGANWVYDGSDHLSSYNGEQCLDVTGGVDADGTKLQIYQCTPGNTNQQWVFNSNFSIQWKNHNKCIDLTDGNLDNQLQIWTCTSGNKNQQWRIGPIST